MNKGGIVEGFCGDSRITKNRDINHLLYLYLLPKDIPQSFSLHLKCQSECCPRIGDVNPDILVIRGYASWKQISNLLTLASTQHGNTLRIENTGSTSWKSLLSSLVHACDDDDEK